MSGEWGLITLEATPSGIVILQADHRVKWSIHLLLAIRAASALVEAPAQPVTEFIGESSVVITGINGSVRYLFDEPLVHAVRRMGRTLQELTDTQDSGSIGSTRIDSNPTILGV